MSRYGGGGGGSDYDDYEDDRRSYRNTRTSTRPRRRDEPDYVEETTYVERGKGPPPRELVARSRTREQEDSVEDVQRDFPPPSGGGRSRGYQSDDYNYSSSRRSRSAYDRRDSYDDEYDDYAAPAAGAAAGYAAGRSRGSRSRRDDYYSDDDRDSPQRRPERKKSGIEGALESLGLGGIAGALAGGSKDKDRSRSRSRGGRDGEGDRSRDPTIKQRQWKQAAQAALVAGAVEAFRSRGEPGPWTGEKGRRIATAAIAAGGVDKLVDKNPDEKSKRHLVEAVLGGLAANRLANGPRSRGRDDSRGRSRSRSRSIIDRFRSKSRGRSGSDDRGGSKSRGGAIKDLAAGGALAAAGKAIYDRVRSRSQGNKRRSPSSGSEDSYVPSRNRRNDREVGSYSQSRDMGPDDGAVAGRGQGPVSRAGAPGGGEDEKDELASSSSSTTDMENRRKKMRGKEFLTAGLASVATIHAAHGVYSSMKASDNRHKLVAEGEMTPEEARKKRSKAWLQDAASIGIAALGIKGAYSEWKEMNEQRHTIKELEERRRARQRKRQQRMERMNGRQQGGNGDQNYLMSGGASGRPIGPPPDNNYEGGRDYNNSRAGDIPPPPMGGGRH